MTSSTHSRHLFRTLLGAWLFALLALILLCPTTPAQAQSESGAPDFGVVTVGQLNLRSGPSTSDSVLGRVPQGTRVEILDTSTDGAWYQARTAGNEGWLFAQFVALDGLTDGAGTVDGAPPAEAATPAETTAPATGGGATATTVPARINVRGGPGTNYAVVSSVAAGTQLDIIGIDEAGAWYQVRGAGLPDPAWVFANLTTLTGTLDGVPRVADADLPAAPAAAPASVSASIPGAPAAAPNTATGFGHGITANLWQGDKQGAANLIKDLGFTWVKQQIRWEYAEPTRGAVQWQEMDGIVDTMNGNGINIMFSVVTSPPWARPTLGGTGGPPEDFQLFANFLGAIAGRYCGRLAAVEVWNEQNLLREWEGFPLEPASYMDLLKRSYNSIKGACPGMLVISGAPTPAGYSAVAFDDVDYLRGMYRNGLAQYSDGIGIHPSGFANPPSVTFEDWTSGNYDALSHVNHRSFYFLSTLRESRRVMEEFGDTAKKLWPTEFGWGSTPSPFPGYEYEARIDEATQARWIVDAFNIMAGSGYVAVPMLWNLNYPRDTEMGAFAVAGRPAFDALRQMMGR
jgi:uncharacterized protein YraI